MRVLASVQAVLPAQVVLQRALLPVQVPVPRVLALAPPVAVAHLVGEPVVRVRPLPSRP